MTLRPRSRCLAGSRPFALSALVALAVLLSAAPRATAADDVLRDEWQVVSLMGARSGYEHTVVRRVAEASQIETTKDSLISIKRLDNTMEVVSHETTVEKADGTLVSVKSISKQSAEESTTTYAFDGGKARVTTETMGTTREAVKDVPTDLVGPWKAERIPLEAGYPAGKTFDAKVFMHDMGGPKTVHTKVVGPEEKAVAGGAKMTLIHLEQTYEGIPMETSLWVNAEGVIYETRVKVAGILGESRRATKEEALAKDDGKTVAPDLFTKTLILSKVLVPHARSTEAATLRIKPRTPGAKIPDLGTDRQTVDRVEAGGATVLKIRRAVPADGGAVRPLVAPSKELAPYLAPSSALQSDDPLIVKSSAEAVGGEKDAWKAAQAIEKWVAKNLTKKNMGVGFASAAEVCKNREGDCTEHAVLVAALCRAAGIPARIVMGLEYLMGIWGGHAWSEVSVAGRWYALDATNGYGYVDALHLSIAPTGLLEGSFGDEMTNLIGIVGSVDIEVLETTLGGRTLAVADPGSIRVEGRRYVNRLYDVSFEAPEGFEVEASVPDGLDDKLAKVKGKTAAGAAVKIGVRADDVPPEGIQRPPGTTDVTVDGRAGFAGFRQDGEQEAYVIVGDTLFRFRVSPGDEAGKKALDAFLATVDLDPAAPPSK